LGTKASIPASSVCNELVMVTLSVLSTRLYMNDAGYEKTSSSPAR
jgi:hypothetical protein